MNKSSDRALSRRDFIKAGAAAGLGALFSTPSHPANEAAVGITSSVGSQSGDKTLLEFKVPPIDPVRIGFVGVGDMGSDHVQYLLKIEGVEIKAVCVLVEEKVRRIQQWVVEAGQPEPEGYFRGNWDFLRLCERRDLDLVFTATPWEWHVPVCVAAMKAGKHVATEVPAAVTLDECWELVETAEKTRRHFIMMENCCYDRP